MKNLIGRIILLIGVMFSILGNLRAPYMVRYEDSSSIKAVSKDLVVKSELLNFDLGKPYTGNISEINKERKTARVTAVYQIISISEKDYAFEFVMPANEEVSIVINGKKALSEKPALLKNEIKGTSMMQFRNELWKVLFDGKMIAGDNTLEVSYSQPVSFSEVHYGYFTKSKWSSAVGYELWPLAEWRLADDFQMKIVAVMENDGSFVRNIFSGKYDIKLRGQYVIDKNYDDIKEVEIKKEEGKIIITAEFKKTFPARLTVLYGDKDALD
jgi:hypothetical protein